MPAAFGGPFGDGNTVLIMKNSFVNALNIVVDNLHPFNRSWSLRLANCKRHSTYPYPQVWGIVETTALPTGPFPDAPEGYAAVGRDMSHPKFRFYCQKLPPECRVPMGHRDFDLYGVMLRARKPMGRGEEIFISYLSSADALAPQNTRHEILKSKWDFECTCEICSHTGYGPLASSTRKFWMHRYTSAASIRTQDEHFVRWLQDRGAPDPYLYLGKCHIENVPLLDGQESWMESNSLGWNLKMWVMIEMEGYVPCELWESVLGRLMKSYSVLEQDLMVEKFALKAAELSMTFSGTTRGWDKVAENPRETDWWAKLGDMRKDREASLAADHGYAYSEAFLDEASGRVYPSM
ncbi:hypothetical protein C8Q79DRAFT_928591 [Trametes meyenii]|nr:hypothetical protein C8Q79DRAFT_928591 [Trametes meyenii]